MRNGEAQREYNRHWTKRANQAENRRRREIMNQMEMRDEGDMLNPPISVIQAIGVVIAAAVLFYVLVVSAMVLIDA